jgi:hypothetical protein
MKQRGEKKEEEGEGKREEKGRTRDADRDALLRRGAGRPVRAVGAHVILGHPVEKRLAGEKAPHVVPQRGDGELNDTPVLMEATPVRPRFFHLRNETRE